MKCKYLSLTWIIYGILFYMKKVLIIGNSAKEYALAHRLSKDYEVHVAPGNPAMSEFSAIADIREHSVKELLDYALENDIDLTIPASESALNSNIVELFTKNKLNIFGASRDAVKTILDKALSKKILYKLHIPTPRFGIFEKQAMVTDYIKNMKGPFVIKTNEPSSAVVFTSSKTAKIVVDTIFSGGPQKVIIEDYIYGTPFSFYALTDGCKALNFGSSVMYKYSLEGDGGQLTSGMGACCPNYKLTSEDESFLLNDVIYPTLNYLNSQNTPYSGILGVNGIISDDGGLQILGYQTFLQDADSAGILGLVDCDVYSLFKFCAMDVFADEVDYIPQKNKNSVSVVLNCKNNDNTENSISGLDEIDDDTLVSFFSEIKKNRYLEYEAKKGSVLVITEFGATVSSAGRKAYNTAETIDFSGKYYRKDIAGVAASDF